MSKGELVVIRRRVDGLSDALMVHVVVLGAGLGEGRALDRTREDVIRAAQQLSSTCERALGDRQRHYDRRAAMKDGD